MIGRTVSHYRILEELGRGGMGVVYLAEDTLLGRRVAVKFPSDPASRSRLLSEARAASALNHPSIAAVYDCGEVDQAPYVVMELVEGASLRELLAAGRPPVERSIDIVRQVAEALQEAHRHHIIHRDIKPSNIRLDRQGAVKVVDFGLARRLQSSAAAAGASDADTQTLAGMIVGTPRYMAPEQVRADECDQRTDLFSLGAVFYECLTGTMAFPGSSSLDALAQVLQVDPSPPSQVNPEAGPRLDRIVAKALAKDPAARYQNAGEFLDDLNRPHAAGWRERLLPRTRRARMLAAAAALALVTAGTAAVVREIRGYLPGPEAERWYRQGTASVRDGAYYSGSKALERAVSIDGRFGLARARLAEAYNELEDAGRAQQEMLKAVAPDVPRVSRQAGLTIQAIHRVVTGDPAGAAAIYRSMVANASEAEKPSLYVDLGRVYEKSQKLKEAMDSYREAARLSPDYPAAWLRLAVLSGRRQDVAGANAAFGRAESLYGSLSNVEGVTEAVCQRGVMESQLGHLAEAATLLDRASQMAAAAGNNHQTIAVLLQRSSVDLAKADTAQAEQHALQARRIAQEMGVELLAMRCLANLGNVYLLRGDRPQAEKAFSDSLAYARRLNAGRAEARAILSLGSLHIQNSEFDRGITEVRQALPFYERGGFQKERSQALLLIARAQVAKADYQGGSQTWQELLDLAQKAGDAQALAQAYEGLGSLSLRQERYGEALVNYQKRLEASRARGNELGTIYGLYQSASALARLGRYSEMEAALKEARSKAAGARLASMLTNIDIISADAALSRRQFPIARDLARVLNSAGEKLGLDDRVQVRRTLGLSEVFSGARDEGARHCAEALELGRRSGMPRLLASAELSQAEALLENGQPAKAYDAAQSALREFARAGQRESEARALLAAARAAQSLSRADEAHELAARSVQSLDAVAETLNAAGRSSYNSRPDVLSWRKQATQILARR